MCRGDAGGVLALVAADVVAGDRGRGGRPGIVSTMLWRVIGCAFCTRPAVVWRMHASMSAGGFRPDHHPHGLMVPGKGLTEKFDVIQAS